MRASVVGRLPSRNLRVRGSQAEPAEASLAAETLPPDPTLAEPKVPSPQPTEPTVAEEAILEIGIAQDVKTPETFETSEGPVMEASPTLADAATLPVLEGEPLDLSMEVDQVPEAESDGLPEPEMLSLATDIEPMAGFDIVPDDEETAPFPERIVDVDKGLTEPDSDLDDGVD